MTIVWNENLKTGITIIDEQHQGLFNTINKLDNFKKTKAAFLEILIELQTYISRHFETEENYMRNIGYPEYEAHKACHDKFAEDYKQILRKNTTVENLLDSAPDLIAFVENWVQNHYSNEDVKMASYINKNR